MSADPLFDAVAPRADRDEPKLIVEVSPGGMPAFSVWAAERGMTADEAMDNIIRRLTPRE